MSTKYQSPGMNYRKGISLIKLFDMFPTEDALVWQPTAEYKARLWLGSV